ncbi:hypothetical protein F5888DRAFT_1637089 [Russula emetica]|nr:hypothetical protein F5888DRAFT_1637089 [Russula emetica]
MDRWSSDFGNRSDDKGFLRCLSHTSNTTPYHGWISTCNKRNRREMASFHFRVRHISGIMDRRLYPEKFRALWKRIPKRCRVKNSRGRDKTPRISEGIGSETKKSHQKHAVVEGRLKKRKKSSRNMTLDSTVVVELLQVEWSTGKSSEDKSVMSRGQVTATMLLVLDLHGLSWESNRLKNQAFWRSRVQSTVLAFIFFYIQFVGDVPHGQKRFALSVRVVPRDAENIAWWPGREHADCPSSTREVRVQFSCLISPLEADFGVDQEADFAPFKASMTAEA